MCTHTCVYRHGDGGCVCTGCSPESGSQAGEDHIPMVVGRQQRLREWGGGGVECDRRSTGHLKRNQGSELSWKVLEGPGRLLRGSAVSRGS